MMADYKTPGVYVVEKSILPASVAGVSTAVPAFIGYTQKAGVGFELVKVPTRITNLAEFEEKFGKAPSQEIDVKVAISNVDGSFSITSVDLKVLTELMHYALQMFFINGGEACYIVSVGPSVAAGSIPAATSEDFIPAIRKLETEDEPTLLVPVDGVNVSDGSGEHTGQIVEALKQCNKLKDRFVIADVITSAGALDDASAFRSSVGINNLKYGAAYYPYLETVLPYQYSDDKVTIKYNTEIQTNIWTDADSDGEIDAGELSPATVTEEKLNTIKKTKTDLYNRIVKEIAKYSVTLPPSSAVAGLYARVDRDRGVWKAPANVSLSGVKGPVFKLTEGENDGLNIEPENGKSINAIRAFSGKGILVWGARTLAGNDNEWRYVSVRRLFNYVEESIQKATSFSVFEPNTAMTWLKVRTMIESFLDTLWRQGALAGAKAEDAYFVQAGLGVTMTSQDILEGRLIVKIGLAAVRPAEFIILEFTHKLQES